MAATRPDTHTACGPPWLVHIRLLKRELSSRNRINLRAVQSYFDRGSLSAEVGKAPVANSLNTILHRIPAGSRSSGLGRAKRTPKVPLAASST